MNGRLGGLWMLVLLPAAACECNDARSSPARSAQPPSSESPAPFSELVTSEGPPLKLPAAEGTPVSPERLASLAPDAIAGFAARGPAVPRSTPLPNGGQLPLARRNYARDVFTLQLDFSDALHAPNFRQLITSRQGQVRKAAGVDFRGTLVAGQPAIVQWHEANRTAVVNMVIEGRFMAHVKVSPAESAELALEVANALPVAAVGALGAPGGTPAKPASP
jgi:hypothetical protein